MRAFFAKVFTLDVYHKAIMPTAALGVTIFAVVVAYNVLVVQQKNAVVQHENAERSKKDLELKITTVKEQGERLNEHQKTLDRAIAELNQAKTRLQEQQIQLTQTIEITRLQQERLNADANFHALNLNLSFEITEQLIKGLLVSDQLL